MTTINFWNAVVFDKETKSIAERALEIVDEYFFFGQENKRVSIYISPPTGLSKAFFDYDHHRSWTNVAFKVASFCLILPPLFALAVKAGLRYYLNISSIQVGSLSKSRNEASLVPAPEDLVYHSESSKITDSSLI